MGIRKRSRNRHHLRLCDSEQPVEPITDKCSFCEAKFVHKNLAICSARDRYGSIFHILDAMGALHECLFQFDSNRLLRKRCPSLFVCYHRLFESVGQGLFPERSKFC